MMKQTRRTQLRYKGTVDFSGGAYGILKGLVEREIEIEGGIEERSVGVATNEGGGTGFHQPDNDLQQRWRELELLERENKVREHVVRIAESESKVDSTLQIQVGVIGHVFSAPNTNKRYGSKQ